MNLAFLKNPVVQKGLSVASALFMGVVAVGGALSDQKKEKEFQEMKKAVDELKKNN